MEKDVFQAAAAATLSDSLLLLLSSVPEKVRRQATEIRLRTGMPLMISTTEEPVFVLNSGGITYHVRPGVHEVTAEEVHESFRKVCGYSVHSYQNEIRNGYLTVKGNRVGFCGTAVIEDGKISTVRKISSMNVRIARQVNGAADAVVSLIRREGLQGILIAGAPASGKTTILKDLVRQLADGSVGRYYHTAVIDERAEIGAHGYACDLFQGYPKGKGMEIAIRTMSPDLMVCDEIGNREDVNAVRQAVHSGVHLVATVHACSPEELVNKPNMRMMLQTGAFSSFFFLQGGQKGKIYRQMSLRELFNQTEEDRADDQVVGAAFHRDCVGDDRDVPVLRSVWKGI